MDDPVPRADVAAEPLLTVPNALSVLRLVLAPVLLGSAWTGRSSVFLGTLVASLLSDLVDGWAARKLGQSTHLGTLLDSWGDLVTYTAVPLCAWWLWPDLIRREGGWVAVTVAAYAFPIALGYLKYGRLTSYHTFGAKLSAVLMGGSAIVLFAGGPSLPFHAAVCVLVAAELEEIALTTLLPEWRSNVPSLLHARRIARGRAGARTE